MISRKSKATSGKLGRPEGWGNIELTQADQARFVQIFAELDLCKARVDVVMRTYYGLKESRRANDLTMFQHVLLRQFDTETRDGRQNLRALERATAAIGEVTSKSHMIGTGAAPIELPSAYPIQSMIAHWPTAVKKEHAPLAVLCLTEAFEHGKTDLLRSAAVYLRLTGWTDTTDLEAYFKKCFAALPKPTGRPRYNIYLRYVSKRFEEKGSDDKVCPLMSPSALEKAVKVCKKHPLWVSAVKNTNSKSTHK